ALHRGKGRIRCSQAPGSGDEVRCLAQLTAGVLAEAGSRLGPLALVHGDCASCKIGGAAVPGQVMMAVEEGKRYFPGLETEEQMLSTAKFLAERGVRVLRGGAFKPRSSPYGFQGLGEEGLKLGRLAADQNSMVFVTEVMDTRDVELVSSYADMLQVGARNMHNFALLKEVGAAGKPVLLKRGLSATVEEWFYAAEYVLSQGNAQVVLAERGIRTYEKWTRNTLDLSAVVLAKQETHLPVIVDVTHAAGRTDLLAPLARAALAAGADGVHVEVHPNPKVALSDNDQQMDFAMFEKFLVAIKSFMPEVSQANI
ncbi:MAG: bifunctional 3-deoxy-7-phosphoheptulonate synthase/chorismate mutase, partial [Deinococcus sp.]|nr:bifunctional 3-deoxy-7-phosphoheptulonate synthase/chorismate mutase [Deinococcus sp.]